MFLLSSLLTSHIPSSWDFAAMPRTTPFSRLLDARAAFVRALALHTDAVRELCDWRLPAAVSESERERRLCEFAAADSDLTGFYTRRGGGVTEHRRSDSEPVRARPDNERERHFQLSWFGFQREHLAELAGAERVAAAVAWAERWKLSELLWARDWVTFALLWWELCRACTVPRCRRGCAAASGRDIERALDLVLSPETLLSLERENGSDWGLSLTGQSPGGGVTIFGGGERLPSGFAPLAHPLMGPNPLLETEREFLRRAKKAWSEALEELEHDGVAISSPRKLALHCEWLVRRAICRQTAAQILGSDDTDLSTVYKATESVAALVGLRIAADLK